MSVITCTNSSCGYVWNYKGAKKFYVTCPDCHKNIKIVVDKKVKK